MFVRYRTVTRRVVVMSAVLLSTMVFLYYMIPNKDEILRYTTSFSNSEPPIVIGLGIDSDDLNDANRPSGHKTAKATITGADKVCRIPTLKKDRPEISHLYGKATPLKCAEKCGKSWLEIDDEGRIQPTEYVKVNIGENKIACHWAFFERVDDNDLKVGEMTPMPLGEKVTQGDYFAAKCRTIESVQVFRKWQGLFMTATAKLDRIMQLKEAQHPKQWSGLNVYVLGFDSVSQMEFRRNMPKTIDYLENIMKTNVFNVHLFPNKLLRNKHLPVLLGHVERNGGLLAFLRSPKSAKDLKDLTVVKFAYEVMNAVHTRNAKANAVRAKYLAELLLCAFEDVEDARVRQLMADSGVERCGDDASVALGVWAVADFVNTPLDLEHGDDVVQKFLERHAIRQAGNAVGVYMPHDVVSFASTLMKRRIGADNRARLAFLDALFHTQFFQRGTLPREKDSQPQARSQGQAQPQQQQSNRFSVPEALKILEKVARVEKLDKWIGTRPEFANTYEIWHELQVKDRVKVESFADKALAALRVGSDATIDVQRRGAHAEFMCVCAEYAVPRQTISTRALLRQLGVTSCRFHDTAVETLWNDVPLGVTLPLNQLQSVAAADDDSDANAPPPRVEELLAGANGTEDRKLHQLMLSRLLNEPISPLNTVRVVLMMLAIEFNEYFGANNSHTNQFLKNVSLEIAAEKLKQKTQQHSLIDMMNEDLIRKQDGTDDDGAAAHPSAAAGAQNNVFTRALQRTLSLTSSSSPSVGSRAERRDAAVKAESNSRANAAKFVALFAAVVGDYGARGNAGDPPAVHWQLFETIVAGLTRRTEPKPTLIERIRNHSPVKKSASRRSSKVTKSRRN